jgi:hypothetical protein
MASLHWPDDLPCPALPAAYEWRDFKAQDEAEAGAPRARARFTRALRNWQATVPQLTRQQVDQLEEFYLTATQRGALAFNAPLPRAKPDGSPQTVEARMSNLRLQRQGVSGGERWQATFDLQEI